MRSTLLLLTAAATLVACAESPTQLDDGEPNFSSSSNASGLIVGFAGGSGHALCTPDGVDCRADVDGQDLLERYPDLTSKDLALRTFTVSAQLLADGSSRGKAQFINRGRQQSADVDVECVLFRSQTGKSNQVWMLGTVTRGSGAPYMAGVRVLFAVEDNGEGPQAADRIVGLAPVPEGQYQLFCPLFNQQLELLPFDGFFAAFSFDPIRGNVQVRPPAAD